MTSSLKFIRKLTIALMISGALNIGLIAFIVYHSIQDTSQNYCYDSKPALLQQQSAPLAIDHSNSEVIRYFKKMPLEWLVNRLNNTQLVENGYTQRDLALASLVAFHHFDINKALSGLPGLEQKRSLVYGKFRDGRSAELICYPGLTDHQCQAILAFASTEKWPLTSQGIFLKLQKQKNDIKDSSLVDALVTTPEFLALKILFSSEKNIDNLSLIQLALDGSWNMLQTFSQEQLVSQDLSKARRQQFLLNYIEKQSKQAAQLILTTDWSFTLEKLDDRRIIQILELLDDRSPDNERFATSLLTSPRTDALWKIASERLYQYAGETIPEKFSHQTALKRFIPGYQPPLSIIAVSSPILSQKIDTQLSKDLSKNMKPSIKINVIKKNIPKAPMKQDLLYVIQEGDTLWHVARRFHIAVHDIKTYNHLNSDTLRIGQSLKIPSINSQEISKVKVLK